MNSLVNEFIIFKKKIKILYWNSNHVPNIDVQSATTPAAGWTQLFFYNINTVFEYDSHEWENDVTNYSQTITDEFIVKLK